MAVQEQISIIGAGLTYPSTKPIASKSHMEVQVQNSASLLWSIVNIKDYDLITNACVFSSDFNLEPYNNVNVRVADTPNELATSTSDIGTVAGIAPEVVIVAGIADEVVITADIAPNIQEVAEDPLKQAIVDATSEPLKQSILDADNNADRAVTAAEDSEASAVESEGSYQDSLLVEADVVAQGAAQEAIVTSEGDDQVDRVRTVANIQVGLVTAEGNTQAARLVADVDVAEDHKGWADADARNADAWANTPVNTDVSNWTWDEINNTLVETPMVGMRSSLHWQTIAQTVASGLKFQGTWDSVDCSQPPAPVPPASELANGYFYIVASVTGDTALCPTLSVGDWVVWSGDLVGDGTIEGGWVVIDWTFDWSAITGVPENVSNALSRAGGVMTAPTTVSYDASAPTSAEYVARSYIDTLSALFMPISGSAPFTAVPRAIGDQSDDIDELTKREYVNTLFNVGGGIEVDIVSSVNPFGDGSLKYKIEMESEIATVGADSSNDSVVFGALGVFANAGTFSLGTRLAVASSDVNSSTFSYSVFLNPSVSGEQGYILDFQTGRGILSCTDGVLGFYSGSVWYEDLVTLSIGSFSHVVLTSNGTEIVLYVDTIEVNRFVGNPQAISGQFGIGGTSTASVSSYTGLMDQLEIYNKVLTISDIGDLFIQKTGSSGESSGAIKDYIDEENVSQDSVIALNTDKVSYKDTMTFDGTTLTITIG